MAKAKDYFSINNTFQIEHPLIIKDDIACCNLYHCLANYNSRIVNLEARMGIAPRAVSTYDVIDSYRNYKPDSPIELEDHNTLISYSGDFGIKEFSLSRKKFSGYQLTANQNSYFLSLDIDSICKEFEFWFTTNLEKRHKENMYPIPIGFHVPDYEAIEEQFENQIFETLRKNEKDNLCYANFTMTSNYRCTLAEWAFDQTYIDCLFPKRFEKQDEKLGMSVLSDERLDLVEFVKKLSSYRFCLCPTGNGLDTYRLWECILMNVVPIAQDNYANRIFSKIWPMILVSRYEHHNLPEMMQDFEEQHGEDIEYDHSLLLQENLPQLLERIKYECDRS